MEKKFNGFMWVQPQFGAGDDYTYRVGDASCHKTPKAAFDDGYKRLDHDDFVIIEWKDNKVIAVYGEPDEVRPDLLEEYGHGIMREFGLA